MYFAPHILQKQTNATPPNDDFGRPVLNGAAETWIDVCPCRCDHGGDKEVNTPDGNVARPSYQITLEGQAPAVAVGDIVRCINANDGAVKAQGRVIQKQTLNILQYAKIYI